MRVIIAGGRDFNDFDGMIVKLDALFSVTDEGVTVISGTANGADKLGERYADFRGYEIERYPAQWDVYGRSAGYKRNEQMAGIASHCVVFWDGQSRGSKHMIDIAKREGLELRVIKYHGNLGVLA